MAILRRLVDYDTHPPYPELKVLMKKQAHTELYKRNSYPFLAMGLFRTTQKNIKSRFLHIIRKKQLLQ